MKLTNTLGMILGRLRRRGIRLYLLVLVALIVLPFAALFTFIYEQRFETRSHHALLTELEVAQGLSDTFDAYLSGIQKQWLTLGQAIKVITPLNGRRAEELLKISLSQSPTLFDLNWLSPGGVVIASSAAGAAGTDLSKRPFFHSIVAGSDLALGDLENKGRIFGKVSATVAVAVRGKGGKLEGVVVAEMDPSRLDEVLLLRKRPARGDLALFDRQGMLVYHSRFRSMDWRSRRAWRQKNPALSRVLASGKSEAGTRPPVWRKDGPVVAALVPVPGIGWVAEASRPSSVAFAEVRRGLLMDSLLGGAVFALAFFLGYLMGRTIIAPIRRLENDARLMGRGEATPSVDPSAPAEVASLRATMHAMTTELTARDAELQESETLLKTVFDNVYDGILIHDASGWILRVNERWLEIFGLSREEVEGLSISDISADPPPPEELAAMWQRVISGETMLFDWRSRRPKDSSTLYVEVFIRPIKFEGQDVIMACIRDITERKRVAEELKRYRDELEVRVHERTEELARALEEVHRETAQRLAAVEELRRKEKLLIQQSRLAAMGEMMANIAHQWRQPLNILGLIVQELKICYKKGCFSEESLMESVAKAMEVINHMSQTIDDFRNLLSPDRAKAPFSVNEVVGRVLSLLQLHAKVEMTTEAECEAEGSRNEFSQVIINIIANAHDIFRERQIKDPQIVIRIFCERGRSVVTIADNGGGVPPDIIDKIFDPYFTTKGPEQGTGLGLFMSKTIIEQSMKGTLTVRNTDEGAEFRIEVP